MAWAKVDSTSISNTPSGSATYSDSFTSDGWADQGSGVAVNTSTGKLEFSSWTDDGTNDSSTLDLGSTLSDTNWVIRFKLQWTGYSNTTDWTGPGIGMWSASSSTAGNVAQDALIYWPIANAASKGSYLSSMDNAAMGGTDTNLSYAWITGTTYYVQLQRAGSSFSATIWTGSYEGTEVASGTNSIDGTNTGLRYFGVKSAMFSRGGSFSGWIDDLEIWDGASVGSGDTLSISGFTATKFNQFMSHVIQDGAVDTALRLAGVSATDYASRFSSAGGGDSTETNHTDIRMENTSGKDIFQVIYAVNIDSEEKLVIIHTVETGGAGASNDPDRTEIVGKMDTTTTSGQFTQVDVINTDSGDMAVDSNLSALGSD